MKKLKMRAEIKSLRFALELAQEKFERLFSRNERLNRDLKELTIENSRLEEEIKRLGAELVKVRQECKTYRKKCDALINSKVSVLCVTEQKN